MAITIAAANQQFNSDLAIRGVLNDGLNIRVATGNIWTYPTTGTDGRIGKLCVSRFRAAAVAGATEPLAVHVTFTINGVFAPSLHGAGLVPPQAIRVEIGNLHFTARPQSVQFSINGDNFVAAMPGARDVATHRGIVNDWLHSGAGDRQRQKLTDIAVKIGLATGTPMQLTAARVAINGALSAFTSAALTAIRDAIRNSLKVEINDNLMPSHLRGVVPVEVVIA